ncbi:MAG: polysaccharide deacetylase family protein [Coriobacteriales bacterium]|nr:polysaccharide deacetylase family protein [Coriobacteriales bacterium]
MGKGHHLWVLLIALLLVAAAAFLIVLLVVRKSPQQNTNRSEAPAISASQTPVSPDALTTQASGGQVIPWTWKFVTKGKDIYFYRDTFHILTQTGRNGIAGGSQPFAMQPQVVTDVSAQTSGPEKVVCLTYDDGPSPTYTKKLLKILQDNDVKATFFEIGSEVKRYPDVSKAVVDAGMELCSHSYNHSPSHYLSRLSPTGAKQMAVESVEAIKQATGVTTTYLRPPGGWLDQKAIKGIGNTITAYVGWNISTGDYLRPGVNKIVSRVVNGVKKIGSGSVPLMHDGGGDRSETLAATKVIIPKLKKMGYSFITIDQLIKLREKELGLSQAEPAALS